MRRANATLLRLGGVGLTLFALATAACEQTVGNGRPLAGAPPLDGGLITKDEATDAGAPDADLARDAGIDAGRALFTHVTIGRGCGAGPEPALFIVLSADRPAAEPCGAHADLLEEPTSPTPYAYAELPTDLTVGVYEGPITSCPNGTDCQSQTLRLDVSAFEEGARAEGTWQIQGSDPALSGPLDASWCAYAPQTASSRAYASGVEIAEIAIYQGVKVPLAAGTTAVPNRNAPVVANRPALVRVFVSPAAGFAPRSLVARLSLAEPAGASQSWEEEVRVEAASTETVPDSTFNFFIDGLDLTPETVFSVELFETAGCEAQVPPPGVRFPAQDHASLEAESVGTLNVVLVPIRYDADGSGRLPDTSEAQLLRYRERMFARYPVPDVNLTVRATPLEWNEPVERTGEGWDQLLGALLSLRSEDSPADNAYYYGIFEPADALRDFCVGGCVAGIGPIPGANNVELRGAIGLGFTGESAPETFVHEIGHTLGRAHAPCDVPGFTDPSYPTDAPYADGRIGAWGFNVLTGQLLDPSTYRDLMGYCQPTWISDYNYARLEERIRTVNNRAPFAVGALRPWRLVFERGRTLSLGGTIEAPSVLTEEPIDVRFVGPDGRPVTTDRGFAFDYSHIDGRLLLVPIRPPGAEQLEVGGLRVRY